MELSPEEYGAYWRASLFVAGGLLLVVVPYRFLVTMVFEFGTPGAYLMGLVLWMATTVAGTYVAILGIARVVRTAVDAEMRA